ncbi:MAG: isopenicillin-N epimerase [Planctomycetota bacterium]|jgi:isopenicillin-N epimerase
MPSFIATNVQQWVNLRDMNDLRTHWGLDPEVNFLNHGSFGACPKSVLAEQSRLRAQLEAEPVRFMVRELPELLHGALSALADFVDADQDGLAFVNNATTGVNAVLRSLDIELGDELLCTNHEYNACRNALEFVAARNGATIRIVDIPFPLKSDDQVVDAILDAVTPKTKLALVDHITSATALVLPIERIVAELKKRGVLVLIDGAHALGMVPLSLKKLGVDFYTSNAHKWLCTPKGSAFLWVAEEHRSWVRPAVISHGANAPTSVQSRYRWEFDWQGTSDPTPWLCIPKAIEVMGGLFAGGWPELQRRNRSLTLEARDLILSVLGTQQPCPDEMIGSIATIPIGRDEPKIMKDHFDILPMQRALHDDYGIQVPFHQFPAAPTQWVRISAQAYNSMADYEALAQALGEINKGTN